MIDNAKLIIEDQNIISRLNMHDDFIKCKSRNNNYDSYKHKLFGIKLSFDFRKVIREGELLGYRSVAVNISPHYHFNNYNHNGNDFKVHDCINVLVEIINYIGISEDEYDLLKVVNIEFGINLLLDTDVRKVVDNVVFYKKSEFITSKFPYYKITNSTKFKQIKVYAKGIQFEGFPEYRIDQNVLRFEVKSKQAKNIRNYGIYDIRSLLNFDVYNRLGDELIKEWRHVLTLSDPIDVNHLLNDNNIAFVNKASNKAYWMKIIEIRHRNSFLANKKKYDLAIPKDFNLKVKIELGIIDKVKQLLKCADSTQKNNRAASVKCANSTQDKNLINDVLLDQNNSINKINVENAHLRRCLTTGLDISMQKENSHYLSHVGLDYYLCKDPKLFRQLEFRFLRRDKFTYSIDEKIKYIAHKIRNTKQSLFFLGVESK